MIAYHATHVRNVPSIRWTGLSRHFSTARRKAVWCVGRDGLWWAVRHVCVRHGWREEDVVLIPFTTTLTEAKRTRWQNVYAIDGNVSPDRLQPTLQLRLSAAFPT